MPRAAYHVRVPVRPETLAYLRKVAKEHSTSVADIVEQLVSRGLDAMGFPQAPAHVKRCRTFCYTASGGIDRCELALGHDGDCPPHQRRAARASGPPTRPSRATNRPGWVRIRVPCDWCGELIHHAGDVVRVDLKVISREVRTVHSRCVVEVRQAATGEQREP